MRHEFYFTQTGIGCNRMQLMIFNFLHSVHGTNDKVLWEKGTLNVFPEHDSFSDLKPEFQYLELGTPFVIAPSNGRKLQIYPRSLGLAGIISFEMHRKILRFALTGNCNHFRSDSSLKFSIFLTRLLVQPYRRLFSTSEKSVVI